MHRLFLAVLALCVGSACHPKGPSDQSPLSLTAVTFNTGTTEGLIGDEGDNAGYHLAQAQLSDAYYGNGLAWQAAVDDTRSFLAALAPDVIGFQELFYSGDCAQIPSEAHAGFVCETWQPGDETVAQIVLGAGYQVACHQGKDDKCVGVKRSFGHIKGCEADLCMDFLDGAEVEGCGSGSRIGRARVALEEGGELTVVNVHGSSGFTDEDNACRSKQFALVFEDLGDGEPAANGTRNLVLGDFNTDPARLRGGDPSADVVLAHASAEASAEKPFVFHTNVNDTAPPTYSGLLSIDHVLSDAFRGDCTHPGLFGEPGVTEMAYFDHAPVVCELSEREQP